MGFHELHQQAIDWEYEVLDIIARFPRAWKLMKKRKNFLVVACDEPYFRQVYDLIRDEEMLQGRWTLEDENHYTDAMNALFTPRP